MSNSKKNTRDPDGYPIFKERSPEDFDDISKDANIIKKSRDESMTEGIIESLAGKEYGEESK